jgi:LysM repeat protein
MGSKPFDFLVNNRLICIMMSVVKTLCTLMIATLMATFSFGQSAQLVIKKTGPDYYLEHKVQPKENWYSVGRTYLLSPKTIAAFNDLSMDKGLSIGQVVRVPLTADNFNQNDEAAFTGPAIVHLVAQGEGLLRLANVYKVTMEQLRKWNRLKSDQLSLQSALIIGFLQAPTGGALPESAQPKVEIQNTKPAQGVTPTTKKEEVKPLAPTQSQPAAQSQSAPPAVSQQKPASQQTPTTAPVVTPVATSAASGYFASLFATQSKEGKQQKMETPAYGVFKSTSGWQDAKYYVLMNNVVPGTVLRISSKTTGKQVYAKVLGAVPPGKESEGLLLRISNATAAALGVPNGEPGVFELVWSN